MRNNLLSGWNFMRWLRLILGIYIGFNAIVMHDALSGLIAGFLLFQVVTNTGCCGISNSCPAPTNHKPNNSEEVTFKEIKTK